MKHLELSTFQLDFAIIKIDLYNVIFQMGNTSVVFVFAIHRDTLLMHVQKSIVDILFHSDSLNKITREHRQKQMNY